MFAVGKSWLFSSIGFGIIKSTICPPNALQPTRKLSNKVRRLNRNNLGLDKINLTFAPPPTSKSVVLDKNMMLEHGTSLVTVGKARKLLLEEFNLVEPEIEFESESLQNKQAYYFTLQSVFQATTVDCAMRIIINDLVHPKNILIEFITTRMKMKRKGFGSQLVKFLLKECKKHGYNVFVVSMRSTEQYWRKFGFKKETKFILDDFTDGGFGSCILMSLKSNLRLKLPPANSSKLEFNSEPKTVYESSVPEAKEISSNE